MPVALASSGSITALSQIYLTHGVLTPLGLSLMSYVPVSVLVTRNFRAQRGLALGIASAGVGIGISVIVPLTQLFIARAGWRAAYFALAAIAAGVVLPIGAFALRDEGRRLSCPAHAQRGAGLDAQGRPEWTLGTAMRSRQFWIVTAAFACLNSPIQLILTHHVAHFVETGLSKLLVAGMVGLIGAVSVLGKIWWGYLADRWWPEWIYLTGCSCVLVSTAILLGIGPASPLWGFYLYAVLMGIGYAVSPAMTPIMCGLYFGGPHFGVIFGALNMLYHAGGATGIWLAGYAHDITGNYRLAFSASMTSVAATVVLVWLAAPRRLRPERNRQRHPTAGERN